MKPGFKIAAMGLLLFICLVARAGADDDAEGLCNSGDAKMEKGDLAGAMADYNRAMALDPKYPGACLGRGEVEIARGDYDGAVADYDCAIALDPGYAGSFYERGVAKTARGDLDGAIADLARSARLDPHFPLTYDCLGAARQARGDEDGAMADFDRAVQIGEKDPLAYLYRGIEKIVLRKWTDALADLRHCCELPAADGDSAVYQECGRLYIWVARAQAGEADAAGRELADYLAKRTSGKPGDWFSKKAGFLAGSVTEGDLFAAASVPDKPPHADQQCEAWFYAGMKKLAGGDKKAAADDFQKCLATKQGASSEYQMAGAELKAMGDQSLEKERETGYQF